MICEEAHLQPDVGDHLVAGAGLDAPVCPADARDPARHLGHAPALLDDGVARRLLVQLRQERGAAGGRASVDLQK